MTPRVALESDPDMEAAVALLTSLKHLVAQSHTVLVSSMCRPRLSRGLALRT